MHLAAGGAIIGTMTDDKVKRRLTTVLCAGVHGYSLLMEVDEAGTLATLRRSRTAIAGLVARHDGRIVNTWGDAVIAEFASVVEAVQCAVEIVTSYRVTMSGQAVGRRSLPANESPPPQAEAVAASEAGAQRIGDRHEPSTWTRFVSGWLANLPRPLAAALTISGFLILINVFTGLHRIWFHWPVAALLFVGILRTVLRRRPASDRKEERPTSRE